MKRRQIGTDRSRWSALRGPIALNAVLLLVLAAVTFGSMAEAQRRPRGEYLMVGGGVQGSGSSAVYILDTVNQEMMAVTYNYSLSVLEPLGYRNVAADTAAALTRRPGN